MSPQYAHHVTLESLSAEWERVQDSLPDNLALRMRRALSWLERAEKETNDDDAAFIFYWIAFNAAYARDRSNDLEMREQHRFGDYIDDLFALDSNRTIHSAIRDRFSESVRVLLENKFVYRQFWNHVSGRGHRDWEQRFKKERQAIRRALGHEDTRFVLKTLFDRLYVLRIQLMHGGATWQGSVNRAQVKDGARIMAFLVPLFVSLMMSHPDKDWGPPDYPVVK